tara:strand:+ start:304 stop:636 length:333 start_codon:yes stop_codon:yes gene_type:complete
MGVLQNTPPIELRKRGTPIVRAKGTLFYSRKESILFVRGKEMMLVTPIDCSKTKAMKYRVDLFSIEASASAELTKMQTKLNQWITAGTLKKYKVHTTSTHIVFNVCRIKD